jgi:ABC-type sugar transport system permease subunit
MSDKKEKYTPTTEGKRRDNIIGRIISTLIVLGICILFVFMVYREYKEVLIPSLIILVCGFIVATIWVKSFYIYRYLLPAMIIILVFTAYPIVYTIYIAFTNFGTGHMQTISEAREILLTTKWDVDYNKPALYAEFYLKKDDKFNSFINEYNRKRMKFYKENESIVDEKLADPISYDDFQAILLKLSDADANFLKEQYIFNEKENKFSIKKDLKDKDKIIKLLDLVEYLYLDDIDDNWVATTLEEIVKKYYNNIKESDITMILYNQKRVLKEDLMGNNVQVYITKHNSKENYAELEKLEQNSISEIIKDKVMVGNEVFVRNVSKLPRVIIEDVFSEFSKELKEYYPLKLGEYNYLVEQSNQFFVKKRSFIIKNNQLYKLAINEDGSLGDYTIPVYEDNKYGNFVITLDNDKIKYWKEYSLNIRVFSEGADVFNYGMGLEKDTDAESYLIKRIEEETDINQSIANLPLELITNKKVEDVNKEDFKKLKKEILSINKKISYFNSKIGKIKKEYIEEKISSIKSDSFLGEKEKKEKINLIKRSIFPKLQKLKIEKVERSNIDYNNPIEMGYSVWVGFNNFTKIFTNKGITTPFIRVFIWTVVWAAGSVIMSFAMGLALALVFNSSDFKGKYIYRAIFILPYAIPGFVSILMWQGFLNEHFGLINNFFNIYIPWLSNGTMARISVLIVNLWLSFPYFMIISLGALQSIDASLYEVADVDGATKFQQFRMITLPLLLIALGPMLVGSFAFSFNNFAGIYLLTGGGPVMASGILPGHTDILISYTYKLAFGEQNKDYGLASAIAIIVFLIIGSITFFNFKVTGTFKEVENA